MKDSKGHGSNPRGAHSEGVDQIGNLDHAKIFGKVFRGEGTVPDDYFNYAKEQLAKTNLGGLLTPQDAAYLITYSGRRFREANSQLRKGKMASGYSGYVKGVNAALDKLPPLTGTSYRSTSLSPKQLGSYIPGAVVKDPGFTSASAAPIDKKFSGYKSKEQDVTMEIHGRSGRDVSALSNYPNEHEVLFKSGTPFRVRERNGNHIVLDEV